MIGLIVGADCSLYGSTLNVGCGVCDTHKKGFDIYVYQFFLLILEDVFSCQTLFILIYYYGFMGQITACYFISQQ